MAGAIAGNIGAALLDAFSLALLIPFLNTLFDQPPINLKAGGLSSLLRATVGVLPSRGQRWARCATSSSSLSP